MSGQGSSPSAHSPPQAAPQHCCPALQIWAPHSKVEPPLPLLPPPPPASSHAKVMQPSPGAVQIPQLELQQVSPAPHTEGPHGSPPPAPDPPEPAVPPEPALPPEPASPPGPPSALPPQPAAATKREVPPMMTQLSKRMTSALQELCQARSSWIDAGPTSRGSAGQAQTGTSTTRATSAR